MMEKLKNLILKKPPARKETWGEILCWTLSCWFIAVGICLILDSHHGFQIGIGSIIWQTLFAVAAAYLLTRRWWIVVIYFGILVPVFFLAISISGDIYGFFESVASFIKWWAASMPYDSKWYSDQGFYLVQTFINIGVGLLFFILARITKKAWVVVALSVVFIAINYSKGYTGFNVLAVPFLLVGIFPLIAGEKFQKIKPANAKNHFGLWGKKWLFVAVSIFMAFLVVLASLSVAVAVSGNRRLRICSDVVADVQTLTDTYTIDQKRLNITLFDLGLVTNSSYIGGNLYTIQPEIIATTDLTEPTLVKLTTFDSFDGANWVNDFKKSYRVNGPWQEKQALYLSTPLADDVEFFNSIVDITYQEQVNITLQKDSNFLPTFAQAYNFTENTPTENPILFDELGRLVSHYGQKSGYSYSLEIFTYDTKDKVFRSQVKSLIKNSSQSDPFYNKNSEIFKGYTAEFSNLPSTLEKRVNIIKAESKTPYDAAYKICKYFSSENGFIYTEKPPVFYRGDNIVEKLFETKQGHCLYYATAMVAMARQAGIPARLAAGYLTIPSEDGKTQIIDRSSPYAWVECYFEKIGWLAFDPTPVDDVKKPKPEKGDKDDNQKPNVDVEEGNVDLDNPNRDTVTKKDTSKINLLAVVLITFAALLLLGILCNTLFSQKAYELSAVQKRFKSTKQQAEFYYQDILRQFAWLGFSFKTGETISELALRACKGVGIANANAVCGTLKVVEALHYGDFAPTDDEVAALFGMRKVFERILKRKNNKIGYALKRRLLLPVVSFKVKKYK